MAWFVVVGHAGRIAIAGKFSAKVFAEAEARRLRVKYPDPTAEFWVSNSNVRPNKSWVQVEPQLQKTGVRTKEIFSDSTKFVANKRVNIAVRKAILAEVAGWRREQYVSCLPYTIRELMNYIEAQFRPGMSWSNYSSEWVIDHIKPRAAFDMRDPKQLFECWALTNLQPLWAFENNSKGTSDKAFVQNAA